MLQATAAGFDPASPEGRRFLSCVQWIALLSTEPMPLKSTPLDAFVEILVSKREMFYEGAERDMVIMHHELKVRPPLGCLSRVTLPRHQPSALTSHTHSHTHSLTP